MHPKLITRLVGFLNLLRAKASLLLSLTAINHDLVYQVLCHPQKIIISMGGGGIEIGIQRTVLQKFNLNGYAKLYAGMIIHVVHDKTSEM
jgi:hypothetical protein